MKYVASFLAAIGLLPSAFAAEVTFNRDIRPLLSTACNKCHGPDAAHREADLRLDNEDGIRHAFDDGLNSEGWKRITSTDPDVVMPPPDSHVELKPQDIAAIKAWVEAGAAYEGHWSFIPPTKPAVPEFTTDAARNWPRNPIDAFILQRLLANKVQPNADADKERLLRRITLDLTGLPPSIADIDAFLADKSEAAYETVVDRLLKSPHFGERMTVVWMDAARYGDTSVFHADGPRSMWPWRDWAIDAYNSNKPFDQFTMEQLAGDLLPNATTQQKVATGFLRNNATTDEGGLIEEEYRVEYAIDRVKTTSIVWMGLSMECAQCHNHKYDPITQKEYYQFFAYFNQSADRGKQTRNGNAVPTVDLFDSVKIGEAETLERQLADTARDLDKRSKVAEGEYQKWVAIAASKVSGLPLLPTGMTAHVPLDEGKGRVIVDATNAERNGKLHGAEKWADGKFGKSFDCDSTNFIDMGDAGDFDGSHGFSYGAWIKPKGTASGAPIARMNNANAFRGYDLHISGGVIEPHIIHRWPDDAIKVRTKNKLKPDEWQHVFVTYDGSGKASGVKIYVDGKPQEWTIEQDGLAGTIKSKGPFYLGRRNGGSHFNGLIDDVRVYARSLAEAEVAAISGNDVVTPLLAKAAAERSDAENATLRKHYLNVVDEPYKTLLRQQAKLTSQIAELKQPVANVMIMNDAEEMRKTYVLARGDYASPLKDHTVQPGVPAALPALQAGASSNRLGLATWLTQPNHPLTARVAVNRYWAMLFGEGIVRSLEDFGAQGEWPSHPALLDWLAVDFVENGWDIKRTIKQMVMSSTYRQSSAVTSEKLAADPENRLLSRGSRFRLQAEFVRDNALAASGLLVPDIGGPGVKPYQPPGLWNEVSLDGNLRFEPDSGEKLYRRSMYTYWKRSAPAPSMTIFDAPTREKCSLKRSRTNTPLQALVTMNDPQFVEAARVLAEAALRANGTSTEQQISFAYRRAAGVIPSAGILAVLREAYAEELERFRSDPESAEKFLSIGDSKRDESLDVATHAALTAVCSMILNLDETLTRG
ncbi:DUF1553 domain-containing protein [Fuerstiella marisgermanici]|uniref:Planctomycete cytochrome C n=1 Tax=Fuerstiella marisgermanici TaxID=1891926 RepID=A0A1P8WPX0_9PLAN|nr:DUF1553 domain-containing protein [Fuerstiella marisgermanici]APZ96102.1 Planctomycete cytochrome C [Fuerstiella marisgermanici]